MSHKTLVIIAVLMLLVFGGTILMYPEIFNPDDKAKTPVTAPSAGAMAPAVGK